MGLAVSASELILTVSHPDQKNSSPRLFNDSFVAKLMNSFVDVIHKLPRFYKAVYQSRREGLDQFTRQNDWLGLPV